MNRRDFNHCLAGSLLLGSSAGAMAFSVPSSPIDNLQEGRDYKRVGNPVQVPNGKIEVIEFFGYWCPHCSSFEPQLDAWARKLPAKVNFRRVPVAIRPNQEPLRKLYLALESLGMVDRLHAKVFGAVHVEKRRMDRDEDIAAFLGAAAGADAKKIIEAMNGFAMSGRIAMAKQTFEAYAIEGVPTLGILGLWLTGPAIAGTAERALAAADKLIAQVVHRG